MWSSAPSWCTPEKLSVAQLREHAAVAVNMRLSGVEENYTHVPLREKDTGTKLEGHFGAYNAEAPPVHQRPLGRNKFAQMLGEVYPGIGPHKNTTGTVNGLYLLR